MGDPQAMPGDGIVKQAEPIPLGNLRGLAAVIASVAAVAIIYSVAAPLIALNLERRGVSSTINGFLAAMPSVAVLTAGVFIPRVVQRIGAVNSIYLGTALAVLALLLFPVLDNLAAWFVLRFVMGASIGLIWIVSETWVNGLAPEQSRGRIMGIYVAVLSAGSASGPLMVGLIGSQGSLPFVLSAAVLALAVLPIPFARRNGGAPAFHRHTAMPLGDAVRRAPVAMTAALLHAAMWLCSMTLLPIYGVRAQLTEEQALLLLSALIVGGMIGQVPIGHLLDNWSAGKLLMLAGLAQTAFAVALPVIREQDLILWPAALVAGAFGGGIYTIALTILGRAFTTDELPSANTAFTMIWELGAFCGPILGGIAMQVWNPHGMLAVSALGGLALVLLGSRAGLGDRTLGDRTLGAQEPGAKKPGDAAG